MASQPKSESAPSEFDAFRDLTRKLLAVPKHEVQAKKPVDPPKKRRKNGGTAA